MRISQWLGGVGSGSVKNDLRGICVYHILTTMFIECIFKSDRVFKDIVLKMVILIIIMKKG